ncbi:hypothetical protein BDR04DRAFT_1158351 [Suillus decipiens]|nr:hypothetical protein BDR04DRAFT_1158351 [Suillus decipiens]
MPRISAPLPFGPVDCSDKVDVGGNHIFMDVENLLIDWPTYMTKFTPTHPGPVTLILHLKDVSRFTYIEDTDSDMETSNSKASKISSSSTNDDPDAMFVSEETTSKTEDDPNLFTATPVKLAGVRKDFTSKKRKLSHGHFFGDAATQGMLSQVLVSKVICDNTYSNKSWSIVAQGMFQLQEINQMEREMCQYLEWELNVDPVMLGEFEDMVKKDFVGQGPYSTYILPLLSKTTPPPTANPFSAPPPAALVPTYCAHHNDIDF